MDEHRIDINDRLWTPPPGSVLASINENDRVRRLLLAHISAEVAITGLKRGQVRGLFAQDWVRLSQRLQIRTPGEEQRRRGGTRFKTPEERHIDAAKTRLRQFTSGHNEYDWVLTGIESVINDRAGLALPKGAYQTQERLDV